MFHTGRAAPSGYYIIVDQLSHVCSNGFGFAAPHSGARYCMLLQIALVSLTREVSLAQLAPVSAAIHVNRRWIGGLTQSR
jgi:hypothetical protein